MKKMLTSIVLVLSMVGTAYAADVNSRTSVKDTYAAPGLAAPAIYKVNSGFAGGYVGASINWENLDVDQRANLDWSRCEDKCFQKTLGYFLAGDPSATSVRDNLRDMSDDAITGGVQLGYNWQIGRVYFGPVVKFDLGGPSADLHRVLAASEEGDGSITHDLEFKVNWKASLLAKVGVQAADWLGVYAIGGVGFVDADVNGKLHAGPIPGIGGVGLTSNDNETLTALTYGLGADVRLSDQWRMFAEWQRFDLDTFNSSSSVLIDCLRYDYDGDAKLDVFRVGVNYAFN
jgi:opacity protein-like surface antigen